MAVLTDWVSASIFVVGTSDSGELIIYYREQKIAPIGSCCLFDRGEACIFAKGATK